MTKKTLGRGRAVEKSSIWVFDAYGTLLDVHSAVRRTLPDAPPAFSALWRSKQLEYTWVRTLCGAYQNFDELTEQALDFAASVMPDVQIANRSRLLAAYRQLDAFPDAAGALSKLREHGAKTAVFSNGTPETLEIVLQAAKLRSVIDHVISVDALRQFKTAPASYALVTKAFDCTPQDICFVSSNRWDIAGATAFGFKAHWVNRSHQPDEYADLRPLQIVSTLAEL
jgi:2-haloacid dehalogenase